MKRFLVAMTMTITLTSAANGQDAGAASSDEVARELANPNTALASMTFKNQFRLYGGSLPEASDQWSYTLLFQPVFPFPRADGSKIIFRPAVPLLIGQPPQRDPELRGQSPSGRSETNSSGGRNLASGWRGAQNRAASKRQR
jgi:hypothetical protein